MTGKESPNVMTNLLVVVIILAIFGIIVAMAMYFTVDLPAMQASLSAPANMYGDVGAIEG